MKFYPFGKQFARGTLICSRCKYKFTTEKEKEDIYLYYDKSKDFYRLMHEKEYKNMFVSCGPIDLK